MRKQNDNPEDELLTSRLLFLSTYDTNLDFAPLFANHGLIDTINTVSDEHILTPITKLTPPEHCTSREESRQI